MGWVYPGYARPEGSEGVEALGPGPLAISFLQVPGGDIIKAGVAQDIILRLFCRHIPAAFAYNHGHLPLVVHLLAGGGIDDLAAGWQDGGRRLEKEYWLLRKRHLQLLGMLDVIQAHADNLAGLAGWQEGYILCREHLAAGDYAVIGAVPSPSGYAVMQKSDNHLSCPPPKKLLFSIASLHPRQGPFSPVGPLLYLPNSLSSSLSAVITGPSRQTLVPSGSRQQEPHMPAAHLK